MSKKGKNIYKRKDGRWEARYKKGNAADGRTLYGYCYGKTYREAKDKAEAIRNSAVTRQKPGDSTKRFYDYCGEWLAMRQERVKQSTMAKYSTVLDRSIKPFFRNCMPEAITTERAEDFSRLLADANLSPKSIKDILVILKSLFKYIGREVGALDSVEVAIPKQKQKEIRVLTGSEEQCFVKFLLQNTDPCKFGILFSLMTGLRIGEVCALRNRDISLTEKTVTVRETMQRIKNYDADGAKTKIIFDTPKSDCSARVVPLTNTAFRLCAEKIDSAKPNAFLLTGSESKFIEPRVLQYRIKKYSEECGIENLHFHALRHTFATRCVEVGFEIKSLSEVLGHSTSKITLDRYVHSSMEFKRQNMAKLESLGF